MKKEIQLDFNSWKPKLTERTRNRMKLQVKLSKEEAQAFKNFMEMVKPPEVPEDDFLKGIFKIGVETMEQKLMAALQEHADKNDIDLPKAMDDLAEEEKDQQEPEEIIVPVMGEVSELKSSTEKGDEVQSDKA